ncbi:hypothetical protein C1I93_12675 [Micromonospora endophytica]|uniref:Uncharacterized protein n=1 Tax=Micromonospora endophytica TaxID=515350 RepID=A0A2W2CF69_9ACTN|nr:hypothetical protein C1I93_12675 [Micromonospora endophytica]RIW46188.1 hypothetical protein D3H59_12715 [Micromonospora endophytica]
MSVMHQPGHRVSFQSHSLIAATLKVAHSPYPLPFTLIQRCLLILSRRTDKKMGLTGTDDPLKS